jgi:hypothetical protein
MSAWYSGALEALSPLRYHMYELVMRVEQYNMFATRMKYPLAAERELENAKDAMQVAEDYCCGKAVRLSNTVTREDRVKIIDILTCDSHWKALLEDGDLESDSIEDVCAFLEECRARLMEVNQ